MLVLVKQGIKKENITPVESGILHLKRGQGQR